MSWLTILRLIAVWYLSVQLISLAVLPLTLRVLRALPDRGYSLAKVSGILVLGLVYWLGFSYGILRNERGGVWLVLIAVAAGSWLVGWHDVRAWWKSLRQGGRLRALLATELVFVAAFVGWALVRAYDPNVDHTEQPMDLMFMNSIWTSATYPPQDAWLSGYAISYYYLGYWLLTTLARVADSAPSIAYNLGQAVWYGYLWVACFGVGLNLIAVRLGSRAVAVDTLTDEANEAAEKPRMAIPALSLVGGFLSGFVVAFIGNLMGILEWLYAQGANIEGLAQWIQVHNFPERASPSGEWFISYDWWWWRSSRVIADLDLAGNYTDVIDEFPMFSYLLGDNHPHVLAMPIVVLVIALALNLLLMYTQRHVAGAEAAPFVAWRRWLPLHLLDVVIIIGALGSLIFLNTWDYPPYWLLLVAVVLMGTQGNWKRAISVGVCLVVGSILVYLPYFLTAQSQAGGIIPNVFNPTRLPQFVVMFGVMIPCVIGLALLAWQMAAPRWPMVGITAAVILGVPIGFIFVSMLLSSSEWGQQRLGRMALPADVTSYAAVIFQRWFGQPWTFLLVGILLVVLVSCLFSLLHKPMREWAESVDLVFVLIVAAIGLALIYAPEFVYLRDFFGSRMNTVFKFYYQGWLLLGLASAYLIVVAASRTRAGILAVDGLALLSLLLIVGSAIFPIAGVYAKTGGFGRTMPTLDSTAYVAQGWPDVMAAVEWVQVNTTPDELVLEGKGGSYAAHQNRVSTMTGRGTLLGWDGHESQWRGEDYGGMARGRPEAIEKIYRTGSPDEIRSLLNLWDIDYVFVGPAEIDLYGITPYRLEEISAVMDTVFSRGQVQIFRRRE